MLVENGRETRPLTQVHSMTSAYWSGVLIGFLSGIILGWTFWGFPVLYRRHRIRLLRQNVEEMRRIQVPLRVELEVHAHVPRHLAPDPDPWWAVLRERLRVHQEVECQVQESNPSAGASHVRSTSGLLAGSLAPWLNSTMVIVRPPTPVRSIESSSMSEDSGQRSSEGTLVEVT